MKILHIIASVDPAYGGPIEGIIRQDAACRAAGLNVVREIATLDLPDAPASAEIPMKVHALGWRNEPGHRPWNRFLNHWRYSPRLVPWLRANINSYDIAIVNGLWNYAPFAASLVLADGTTPYFLFPHGMMDPWFRKQNPIKHLAKQAFWLVGEGKLAAGARSVLFTCDEERRKARGQFVGHRGYREMVVGYGAAPGPIDTPLLRDAFVKALPSLKGRPYILFLSRIHPKKGCDILIRAFSVVARDNAEVDLVIAGPDQMGWRDQLEALANASDVAHRIHWAGPLYGDAKWGALHGAEAFILPSHQENFGIAVAEALGCGTPVLISDKVDIWREIEAAGAGIVGSDTIEGVEILLRGWIATDRRDRIQMGINSKVLFDEKFNVNRTALDLIDTIEHLVEPRRVCRRL